MENKEPYNIFDEALKWGSKVMEGKVEIPITSFENLLSALDEIPIHLERGEIEWVKGHVEGLAIGLRGYLPENS